MIINKRAAGEGLSWAAGLIAIALIVIFAVFFSIAGKFSQKSVVINYDSNVYSSESQRVAAYAVISDFNSSSKGKVLYDAYKYTNTVTGGFMVNLPKLSIPNNYTFNLYPLGSVPFFADKTYFPCSHCEKGYLSITVIRRSNYDK